jgi:hypothetical protein
MIEANTIDLLHEHGFRQVGGRQLFARVNAYSITFFTWNDARWGLGHHINGHTTLFMVDDKCTPRNVQMAAAVEEMWLAHLMAEKDIPDEGGE